MKHILLAITSIISSLILVLLLILLGWYIVWKLFLSRFKFVRELLGGGLNDPGSTTEVTRETRSRVKKTRRD